MKYWSNQKEWWKATTIKWKWRDFVWRRSKL